MSENVTVAKRPAQSLALAVFLLFNFGNSVNSDGLLALPTVNFWLKMPKMLSQLKAGRSIYIERDRTQFISFVSRRVRT